MILGVIAGAVQPEMLEVRFVLFASHWIFCLGGIAPTLGITKALAYSDPSVRAALEGDHYIDVDLITGELRALIAKHTNGTFRRPWPRPWLRGTEDDLRTVMSGEFSSSRKKSSSGWPIFMRRT